MEENEEEDDNEEEETSSERVNMFSNIIQIWQLEEEQKENNFTKHSYECVYKLMMWKEYTNSPCRHLYS